MSCSKIKARFCGWQKPLEPGGSQRVVGMVVVWLIVDEAHIATIAVHPDYRGQGIAQELLCAALIESIEKGMRNATLEVRAHNLSAQRLYQPLSFRAGRRAPALLPR